MAVIISSVVDGSLCSQKGIESGFVLHSVNGHEIKDVIDFRFFAASKRIILQVFDLQGNEHSLKLKTSGNPDDLGLEFETYLMDKQHSCKNKCIFCFVDQMPEGMRESLYFKDDDSRLSFLFGNYITLTNMTEDDISRIINMHISPVNVSVHTMNPTLRVEMMKNPNAGKVLSYLKPLADAGIDINAQLVLCPGINDGKELLYSLNELYDLGESIVSVACVPVGLTKHRKGLFQLMPYNKDGARQVIEMVDKFNADHFNEIGRNFAYAADEFYLQADMNVPPCEYYDDFRQLDNGVGLLSLTESEFLDRLDSFDSCPDKKVAIITGVAATELMKKLSLAAMMKFHNLTVDVKTIVNDFFGHTVTVAGLVTAGDIIKQCGDMSQYDYVIVPSVMLRDGDDRVFLDDISIDELSLRLNVPVKVSGKGGDALIDIICCKEGE